MLRTWWPAKRCRISTTDRKMAVCSAEIPRGLWESIKFKNMAIFWCAFEEFASLHSMKVPSPTKCPHRLSNFSEARQSVNLLHIQMCSYCIACLMLTIIFGWSSSDLMFLNFCSTPISVLPATIRASFVLSISNNWGIVVGCSQQ